MPDSKLSPAAAPCALEIALIPLLPLLSTLVIACAHDRPLPPASSPDEGALVVLDHRPGEEVREVVALALAGPDGVTSASTFACPQAPAALLPIADGRALATVAADLVDAAMCAARPPTSDAPPRDLVAFMGLSPAPLVRVEPELAESAAGELAALAEVAAREAALQPENFVVRTTLRAYDLEATRWAVVTLHFRPREGCTLPACAVESPCASASHSAIVVYSWNKLASFRGRASLRRHLLHMELGSPSASSPARPPGLLDPIDLVAVAGADSPWLVAARRGCETDDFLLFGPTGAGWGVLAGPVGVAR